MKVPLLWLKDYVDFEDTPQGLADRLTFSGIEVEALLTVGADCPGVVAGEVRDVRPHPDADRLRLCTVWDGSAEVPVVCGAPRIETGGVYAFAPAGVRLPGGPALKKTRIRGAWSEGMLCAEDELGLSDDHTGLFELDAGTAPGTPLHELIGPPQIVLELEITPNRPDCLSLMGVAREVAALCGAPLKRPDPRPEEDGRVAVEDLVAVTVEDAERCPRYTAHALRQVRVAPSPLWMRRRLRLAGLRPINNVVDITNFVMLECGQPLHAFDRALLAGARLVIRRARPGETLRTLDDTERPLDEDLLVIADAERAVALAGVMGGANSEIGAGTNEVVIESACFAADPIRRTARTVGLSTDSSYRFERGVDIGLTAWAGRRAAALVCELAGARCAAGVIDAYPNPPAPRRIACRAARASALLGVDVAAADLSRILASIELPVVETTETACTVEAPTFRGDLALEVDLIEEYARLRGLEHIPSPAPQTRIVPGAEDVRCRARSTCRAALAALGLHEVVQYSLVSHDLLDLFDRGDRDRRVELPHPISRDQSVLRTALTPQMTAALGYNRARQAEEAALFEIGRVFHAGSDGAAAEEERLALGVMGPVGRPLLDRRRPVQAEETFFWIKGMIAALAAAQRTGEWSVRATGPAFFEPGLAAEVLIEGRLAGHFGVIRESLRRSWRLADPVAVAELRLDPFLARRFESRTLGAPAPYPSIQRDVALLAGPGVRHAELVDVMRSAAPPELEKIELFDLFTGAPLGPGRRGMAYALTYRAPDRTLTDEEANAFHERVKQALRDRLDIEIRDQ